MEWLQGAMDWIVTHWKAVGIGGLVGFGGRWIHWWFDYRKKRAEAHLSELALEIKLEERSSARISALRLEIQRIRDEQINIYVVAFREWWTAQLNEARKRGQPISNLHPVGEPRAMPGESSELVAEAWKRFIAELRR